MAMKYRSAGFAIEHFLVNEFGEPPDLEWFHHDFVRL
jgi:hypothetical protein